MSQISSPISLPQLVYKGVPVITTDTLAQAYEVETHQIRQNFKNNKERFVEGKHLFSLSGNDLREFKHGVENFYSVPKNVNALVLWTERGAARHAKMLNSDKAWDVFEVLEETFFRVGTERQSSGNPEQPTSPISRRTDPERKVLTAIINTWVGLAPIHYASARAQVNAHFGVASVDALTVAQVKEALRFVQGKIDALPPVVTEPVRLPMYREGIFHSVHTDKKHVAGPREEALKDFWSKEYGPQSAALEDKFREMLDAIDKATGADLFSYAVSAIGRDADTSFGVSCLLDGMYAAKYMARSAFKDAMSYLCLHMRMATSVATALNR